MNSRLALGTVQFGLPYGVANQAGRVSRNELAAILDCARAAGVGILDTAIAYGDSEQRLGEYGVGQWQVISKLPAIPENRIDVASWVQESVIASLDRLRIPKLRGLLLHRPQQLRDSRGEVLYRALATLKDQGKVEKIGVSVYDPEELNSLWPRYQFDLVQAPFSIVDRRFLTSGWLKRLHDEGTEVHVRSVFLQGLLLMDPKRRPAKFNRWQPLWEQWHSWLHEQSVTPVQACLGFALSRPEIDRVVVGVDSRKQLDEILVALEVPIALPPKTLVSEDVNLINPSRWNVH